jgi:stage IV sporulation protein FB
MCFTVKNCHITISFYFVAMLTILLLEDQSGTAFIGILAATLHETGHLVTMRAFGVKPSQIRFNPFGIDIIKSCCADHSYQHDALISLAGPGANAVAALLMCTFQNPATTCFILVNLIIALFNLLPIEPLDGGQALYSILCIKFSADQSAKIVAVISFLVVTPLAVFGFLILFHSPGNFSLLLACGYLIVLLVLKNGRYY